MNRCDAKEVARKQIDSLKEQLFELSDRIHQNPEIKHEEYKACEWLSEYLTEQGFEVETKVGGLQTSFTAKKVFGSGKPHIAFCAEYDALPNIGHACGHNVIGLASVAAGLGLARALEESGKDGTVTVFGTPGEEGGGGKVYMARAGLFKDVDACLMIHPADRTTAGRTSNTSGRWRFKFYGRSAHGAGNPHLGINALDAVLQTFNMVNGLRQHTTEDCRLMGIITNGGQSVNAIPEVAECWFSIRAARLDTHQQLMDRVKKCADAAALATGCKLESEYPEHYPHNPVRINEPLNEVLTENLEALGIEVDPSPEGGKGSTDFGNVSWEVPGVHGYIAIVPRGTGGHSTELREAAGSEPGHKAIVDAGSALAMSGIDLVWCPELIKKAWEDFEERARQGI